MLAAARILGSGGYFPTETRETSCLLLRGEDGTALVVDAGTGLRRLITQPELLDGADELDLVLTHFHPDHVIGLTWASEIPATVRLWGPGAALYGRPTEDILTPLFSDPIMLGGLAGVVDAVGDVELGETTVGSFAVTTRRQDKHPSPTLGLRFGDRLTWCTDTELDPGTADFARGSDVLCHDAWDVVSAEGHTTAAEAGKLAKDAGARRLVLIHVPPMAAHDSLLAEAATGHPDVCLARDGLDVLA
jgi:ribonuclease BN (tRNA processing enzyme)